MKQPTHVIDLCYLFSLVKIYIDNRYIFRSASGPQQQNFSYSTGGGEGGEQAYNGYHSGIPGGGGVPYAAINMSGDGGGF